VLKRVKSVFKGFRAGAKVIKPNAKLDAVSAIRCLRFLVRFRGGDRVRGVFSVRRKSMGALFGRT